MRTIIAGSRSIVHYEHISKAMETIPWKVTTVISGNAKGADALGEVWAYRNNIPVEYYRADWKKYGQGAGYIRNEEMAEVAEALLLLWDGKSNGSRHMLETARKFGLPTHLIVIE